MKFPPWWGYGYFLEPHNGSITMTAICETTSLDLELLLKLLFVTQTQAQWLVSMDFPHKTESNLAILLSSY